MNMSKLSVINKIRLYFKNHSEEIAMVLYAMSPNAGNWAYLPKMIKNCNTL